MTVHRIRQNVSGEALQVVLLKCKVTLE